MPKTKKKSNEKPKKKKTVVQIYNPTTKRWVKIDRTTGKIISHKKTEGAYKDIPKGKPISKYKKPVKPRTQKTKKEITHKLTYKPRKAVNHPPTS